MEGDWRTCIVWIENGIMLKKNWRTIVPREIWVDGAWTIATWKIQVDRPWSYSSIHTKNCIFITHKKLGMVHKLYINMFIKAYWVYFEVLTKYRVQRSHLQKGVNFHLSYQHYSISKAVYDDCGMIFVNDRCNAPFWLNQL